MKKIFQQLITFAVPLMIITSCSSSKQVTTPVTAQDMQAAINNNQWLFTADYVMPQSARSRNINGVYTISCTDGKITVQLPYFGRGYAGADVFSTKSVLDFASTDFDLDKQEKKEGEWRLVFKPKDNREIQSCTMNFYSNGSANVDFILTNHSPISFRGRFAPKK